METTDGIRATLNYFAPGVSRGRFDLVEPERNLMVFEGHEVTIRTMRGADLSADREGFELARHASAFARLPEMQDINVVAQNGLPPVNRAYYDELLPLIEQISGAREVIPQATGLTVRFSNRSARKSWAAAAGFIHLDVSAASIDHFLAPSLAALGRPVAPYSRVVLYQTWRAISPPPQDNLLALCDRRSVREEDVVYYDAVLSAKGNVLDCVEARSCRYHPDHRWWYAPAMDAEDVLVFVGYDSAAPHAPEPFHTGFDVPGHEDATPRASLEARFFAFYD